MLAFFYLSEKGRNGWCIEERGPFPKGFKRLRTQLDAREQSVDQRKQTEEKYQTQVQRLAILREIGLSIISSLDLSAVLDVLMSKTSSLLSNLATEVWLLTRGSRELELKACGNIDEKEWRHRVFSHTPPFLKAALEQKTPQFVNNVQTDPRILDTSYFRKHGLVSYLGVPLIAKGEVQGVIIFLTREEHEFSSEERDFLITIADEAAIAIHNSRLFEQVEKSNRDISALQAITATASESLALDTILHDVLKKITEIFGFDATRIFLLNSQMDEVNLRVSFETDPEFFAHTRSVQWGQGIPGWVVKTGEPVIFENTLSNPRYQELSHTKFAHKGRYSFLAAFPIKSKLRIVGAILCIGQEPRHFTSDEIQLITSMADQIGVSVENAQLYERIKEQTVQLENEIIERKQVEEDRETLLHNMRERVKELRCMYGVAKSIQECERLEDLFVEVASLIPLGWQYPEITRGKLIFDGKEYVSELFEETEWKLSSNIVIGGKRCGCIEAYYLEQRIDLDEGPFLKEERHLIDGMARALSEAVQCNWAEQELRVAKESAEAANIELRKLAQHTESVRELERAQIARDVHDDLGQSLAALKFDLSWLKKRLPKNQDPLLERTESMSQFIDSTVRRVREISTALRPGVLDDFGLVEAIRWQAQVFQNRPGIKCKLAPSVKDVPLDRTQSISLFRIFQETLTNVAIHSRATEIKVTLVSNTDRVLLEIMDNGRGITNRQISSPQSPGIQGMRERTLFLGGEFNISGIERRGTTVSIRVPLGK